MFDELTTSMLKEKYPKARDFMRAILEISGFEDKEFIENALELEFTEEQNPDISIDEYMKKYYPETNLEFFIWDFKEMIKKQNIFTLCEYIYFMDEEAHEKRKNPLYDSICSLVVSRINRETKNVLDRIKEILDDEYKFYIEHDVKFIIDREPVIRWHNIDYFEPKVKIYKNPEMVEIQIVYFDMDIYLEHDGKKIRHISFNSIEDLIDEIENQFTPIDITNRDKVNQKIEKYARSIVKDYLKQSIDVYSEYGGMPHINKKAILFEVEDMLKTGERKRWLSETEYIELLINPDTLENMLKRVNLKKGISLDIQSTFKIENKK